MELKTQEQILDDCMAGIVEHTFLEEPNRELIRLQIAVALTESRYAGQIEGIERLSSAVSGGK